MSACVQGATKVFAIDRLPGRLAMEENFGSVPVNFEEQDSKTVIDAATQDRGDDVPLEAVVGKEPLDSALRVVPPAGWHKNFCGGQLQKLTLGETASTFLIDRIAKKERGKGAFLSA